MNLPDRFFKTEDLLEIFHVDRATLWRWRRRSYDPLPTARVGRRLLYPKKLLEEWISRQTEIREPRKVQQG